MIHGGTVVTAGGSHTADVAVRDGLIEAIGPGLAGDGARVVDATGMLVLPGVIDVHTHLRLPDAEHPDRFRQDTMAAARGGTTTVLTFNNPGTGITEAGARSPLRGLDEFRSRTDGESPIDFGLCAVISGQQDDPIGELPALIEAGVPTFKAFMVYDFRLADDDLLAAMRTAARHGGMLQVHCEEPAIIDPLVADALREGHTACRYHALTRPSSAEGAATRKAIEMARRADAPLYVVHLSCDEALEAVAEAKQRGQPVYAETCPHYLTFTDAAYDDPEEAQVIKRVISPPLRTRADLDALWAGLRDGVLDVVGSDHVPDRLDTEKRVPAPPFPEISNGGPGIETLLARPLLGRRRKGSHLDRAARRGAGNCPRAPIRPSVQGSDRGGQGRRSRNLGSGRASDSPPGGTASHQRLHAVRGDGRAGSNRGRPGARRLDWGVGGPVPGAPPVTR